MATSCIARAWPYTNSLPSVKDESLCKHYESPIAFLILPVEIKTSSPISTAKALRSVGSRFVEPIFSEVKAIYVSRKL